MLEQLTEKDWSRFIGSIIKRYMTDCKVGGLIEPNDLEQEAWAALLRAAQNYQTEKSSAKFTSYAWLYIDYDVRKLLFPRAKRKHKTILQSDLSEDMPDIEDPFDDFMAYETDDAFKIAISKLNTEDFELIDQHFVQGLTFPEMARIADVTPQRMHARVKKIIDRLRGQFEDTTGS